MNSIEIDLATFATVAKLNEQSEEEIIRFFRSNKLCKRAQAEQALRSSKAFLEHMNVDRVVTVGHVRLMLEQFLIDQEKKQKLEDEQWWDASPNSRVHAPAHANQSSSWCKSPAIRKVSFSEESQLRLAQIASELQDGQFLVRSLTTLPSNDPAKVHDLVLDQVYVIDQVRYLDDGTRDAWFCGFSVDDPHERHKWIFSQYVGKIFG